MQSSWHLFLIESSINCDNKRNTASIVNSPDLFTHTARRRAFLTDRASNETDVSVNVCPDADADARSERFLCCGAWCPQPALLDSTPSAKLNSSELGLPMLFRAIFTARFASTLYCVPLGYLPCVFSDVSPPLPTRSLRSLLEEGVIRLNLNKQYASLVIEKESAKTREDILDLVYTIVIVSDGFCYTIRCSSI